VSLLAVICRRLTWGPTLDYYIDTSNSCDAKENDRTKGFHTHEFAMILFRLCS